MEPSLANAAILRPPCFAPQVKYTGVVGQHTLAELGLEAVLEPPSVGSIVSLTQQWFGAWFPPSTAVGGGGAAVVAAMSARGGKA